MNLSRRWHKQVINRLTYCALTLMLMASCVSACGDMFLGPDPENTAEENFEILWESFDRYYAHFDLKNIDWHALYATYRPKVHNQMTDEELFEVMFEMISHLQDGHVYLSTPKKLRYSDSDTRSDPRNYSRQIVQDTYLQNRYRVVGDGTITYGRINGDIGYISISSLTGGTGHGSQINGWVNDIDIALDTLKESRGIILDLRDNSGGRAFNAQYLAGRFADTRRPFVVTRSRNGPRYTDFSAPFTWYLEPNGGVRYTGPLVVLTNRYTFSAAEWLTLALKQLPQVTHIGARSGGGLAMFLPRELPNGWTYTISIQKTQDIYGRSYEIVGIPPDIPVDISPEHAKKNQDTIMDTAIQYLYGYR